MKHAAAQLTTTTGDTDDSSWDLDLDQGLG
jgi:hypothetical protein